MATSHWSPVWCSDVVLEHFLRVLVALVNQIGKLFFPRIGSYYTAYQLTCLYSVPSSPWKSL